MNRLIIPELGPATTTATKLTAVATTIPVKDTTGFDSAGTLSIAIVEGGLAEIVTYSGKTATSFTGCTRGTNSTVAAAYPFASYVVQAQWMPVIAEADTLATTSELAAKNPLIDYLDEGLLVASDVASIDFVGAGVMLTETAPGELEVSIPGGGSGTVTDVSVVSANGVSGSVATSTTTPAITLALGAITPSSVASVGTVTGSNLSGTNTGDQTTVTGNAGTATTLQTARNINTVSFNGSANIQTPFIGQSDVPASYSSEGGKAVAVNFGETGLEFVDFPSSGLTQPQVMARTLGC